MKIAILSSGFLPVVDGITVTLYNRLQKLSELGHRVLLFCPDYRLLARIYPNWQDYTGEIFSRVKIINLASTGFLDWELERSVDRRSYHTVLEALTKFKPDIIHIDEPERLFLGFWKVAGKDFAKQNNIPCVSFFHTNFLEYGSDYFPLPAPLEIIVKWSFRLFLRWLYNSYDRTITSSRVTQQKLQRMGIKRIVCGDFLGVDINNNPASLRRDNYFAEEYNLPHLNDKTKLIFLGRLTPDKGWNFTIDLFPELARKIDLRNIAILIAGDGIMRDRIAEKLTQFGQNIHFLGRIDPDRIPALLANSDIHITASEKETKGLTILEAFAAGIPAIAPRSGGFIDTINDGIDGFLYAPQDKTDFIAKLELLIENPSLRQKMGDRARQDIVNYSWDRCVANLIDVWEREISLAIPLR
jgi:glycosyltransferase involved in cell wall biosynthesis